MPEDYSRICLAYTIVTTGRVQDEFIVVNYHTVASSIPPEQRPLTNALTGR